MLFLLVAINAKYIHSNPAVYSLRGFLSDDQKTSVSIAEYTINQSTDEILADIVKRNPTVIGFSCYIWNIRLIRELLIELPKLLPGTDIWLGGPEVSFHSEKLLEEFPCVTGIMVGEGEETFRELVQLYITVWMDSGVTLSQSHEIETETQKQVQNEKNQKKSQLGNIAGLYIRSGRTAERSAMDMNRLPFLYQKTETFHNRIIYYESSRGCPYRCSYCLSSIERELRFRDLETVKTELQHLMDEKVSQVKFVDRTFNCRESHALAIWNYIKEHDNGVTNFHFEIAADRITDAELELLKTMRPGLIQLEIGVQTTNPKTLQAINRVTDLKRLSEVVTIIREQHNIHQHLDLIAGLPYEDYESFSHSLDFVYSLQPQQLQLGFLKVLHGTEIERDAGKYGIYYKDTPPYEVLYTKDISYAEICKLKRIEEMVELYYNSGQFTTTLRVLVREFPSPFTLFEELADFYEKQGYFINQPSRIYRYEVLLAFIESKESLHMSYYRECLTYDLYLRENLRSRPSFARNLQPFRESIKAVYEQEEQERKLLPSYRDYDRKQMEKMTHIEVFHYPVWEMTDSTNQPNLPVLFDYQNRDALTNDAAVILLPPFYPT